uniref:Glyoxalase domain-containing protein 4-like n=1 Tax=Phallusia mammillata TaxID=59560 RepID=A0A6F9DD44_9ASCI|nr:glyoxalase domain-containing protein 4-like [Phallusia mammillata]
MSGRRTLHYVFKVGNRTDTLKFYREILGMKVLRHEEFEEGCKATCNGPYDGKWSKTMIGYGPEDNHFVCELTYNYGIGDYALGNDFQGITIKSKQAIQNCKSKDWPISKISENKYEACAPGGYKYILLDEDQPSTDPVQTVSVASSDLAKSMEYWTNIAGMKVFKQGCKSATLGYCEKQASLTLLGIDGEVEHKKAFGRVAISCPREQLQGIQDAAKAINGKILTELVSLDTPGKATVEVVILADPDGHEICFVGDEAFKELSQVDPKGEELINEAIAADKSSEWYAKRNRSKPAA